MSDNEKNNLIKLLLFAKDIFRCDPFDRRVFNYVAKHIKFDGFNQLDFNDFLN